MKIIFLYQMFHEKCCHSDRCHSYLCFTWFMVYNFITVDKVIYLHV